MRDIKNNVAVHGLKYKIGKYSGCQKNVPLSKRFFLQPHIPQFHISKHIYEKWYRNSGETT